MEAKGTLTGVEIEADLRDLGLGAGDKVLVHSSLASLGRVAGGAQTVVRAILNVLGEQGTLVVPIFGDLGIITKTIEAMPGSVKSVHPLAAVAAVGRDAQAICRGHWKAELAHGMDTPYTRLADVGGWVLLLGVDQDRNTTLHTVEELLRLPYLKTTEAKTFDTPDGPVTKSWPLFPGPHRDFIGIDHVLRASGKMKVGRVGNAVARLIRSRDLIDVITQEGRCHPAWALCENPNCADCVKQRASLRRARFADETFRLAAGARLAGRYVPEVIENLHASGIGAVELDWIQGMPAFRLADKPLVAACEQFRQAGIEVSAFRVIALTGNIAAILDRAKTAGIGRVLLPLSHLAAAHAKLGTERGIETAFFNHAMTADVASDLLLAARDGGVEPRFAFNAAAFARSGEKPFLKSYKQKLRRFVDQLDLEDALFDGTPAQLAEGNAEIKEMVSILRCASFGGWFVLTSACPPVTSLRDAVAKFSGLLERM